MVKKHKIGLFLKNVENFVRVKKSTQLTISMNPQEVEYDYIADESPTTEVDKYKPTIDQDLVMYKGQPDYEMLWPYFYEMRTGTEAHTECLVVFMHEPVDGGGYKAWKTDSVISVQDMNANESKLNVKVNFAGTIARGTATVDENGVPVFTPEVSSDVTTDEGTDTE